MKIAITGGNGFIGARLAKALKKAGHDCEIIDISGENPCDILNLPALSARLQGCGAVYHLAAEHRDDVFPRERYYDVNVQGARNICAAAAANGIGRIIFTSSFAVYGLNGDAPDENAPPSPFNDYGQSKLEAEGVFKTWGKETPGAGVTIIRPVVVFGEGNRGNVHTLISQIAAGRFIMIGDGKNKKSMAYAGNVAAFLQHCLSEDHAGQVYNYADAPDYSMRELVESVCERLGRPVPKFSLPYAAGMGAGAVFDAAAKITGRRFPISRVRIEKFCATTTCNASKAHRVFKAPYTLSDGLNAFIDHDFPKAAPRKAA